MRTKTALSLILGIVMIIGIAVYFVPERTTLQALAHACESDPNRKQQCYEELVLNEANEKSVSAGFDALAYLYERDAEFATFCHGNTHELGEIAYRNFTRDTEVDVSPKTAYCGFGFYHGFLEALLAETGDLSEARRYCAIAEERLKNTFAGVSFACYHGIGHGVVDGSEPDRWGDASSFIERGLKLCDTLGEVEEHKERCASGVFNALALAYRNPTFSLSIDTNDPYAICRAQSLPYAEEACHDQMNTYVIDTSPTFSDALALARRSASPTYVATAIEAAAGYRAQSMLESDDTFAASIAACSALEGDLVSACIRGLAGGMIEFGKPGHEYDAALRLCSMANTESSICYQSLFTGVRDRVPKSEYPRLCTHIEVDISYEVGERCREILL